MRYLSFVPSGVLALATAVAVLTSPAQAKEWKSVTIALEGGYEPWNLTNPDGSLGGFEPELAANLCARLKIECKLISQDFDGMIASLQAGKFDIIMDALSITDERKEAIAFSKPYAATPAVFVASKSGPLANLAGTGTTLKVGADGKADPSVIDPLRKALTGKSIGIQAATVYSKFIYDNFKDVATIREYKTAAEHDLDVTSGRIDVAFDDATYFVSAFSKPDNADLAFTGPQFGGDVWGEGEGLGLRKGDTDLKALFDKAIADALKDGTVKTLSEKWFKMDVSP
jgi:octopine/nopaline transport system substrate-binding protein